VMKKDYFGDTVDISSLYEGIEYAIEDDDIEDSMEDDNENISFFGVVREKYIRFLNTIKNNHYHRSFIMAIIISALYIVIIGINYERIREDYINYTLAGMVKVSTLKAVVQYIQCKNNNITVYLIIEQLYLSTIIGFIHIDNEKFRIEREERVIELRKRLKQRGIDYNDYMRQLSNKVSDTVNDLKKQEFYDELHFTINWYIFFRVLINLILEIYFIYRAYRYGITVFNRLGCYIFTGILELNTTGNIINGLGVFSTGIVINLIILMIFQIEYIVIYLKQEYWWNT